MSVVRPPAHRHCEAATALAIRTNDMRRSNPGLTYKSYDTYRMLRPPALECPIDVEACRGEACLARVI
ncbi:MAG: hypothetical protein LBM98_12765 [Oscillospiraceae bacterium]|nr:hypothetical protein [Oscillospiraceae bacterium]